MNENSKGIQKEKHKINVENPSPPQPFFIKSNYYPSRSVSLIGNQNIQ